MNTLVKDAAAAYVAPKVLQAFRFRWIVLGAAAYFGLRLMRQRGIFPKQAGAALDVIDNGFAALKSQVGLGHTAAPEISQTVH